MTESRDGTQDAVFVLLNVNRLSEGRCAYSPAADGNPAAGFFVPEEPWSRSASWPRHRLLARKVSTRYTRGRGTQGGPRRTSRTVASHFTYGGRTGRKQCFDGVFPRPFYACPVRSTSCGCRRPSSFHRQLQGRFRGVVRSVSLGSGCGADNQNPLLFLCYWQQAAALSELANYGEPAIFSWGLARTVGERCVQKAAQVRADRWLAHVEGDREGGWWSAAPNGSRPSRRHWFKPTAPQARTISTLIGRNWGRADGVALPVRSARRLPHAPSAVPVEV